MSTEKVESRPQGARLPARFKPIIEMTLATQFRMNFDSFITGITDTQWTFCLIILLAFPNLNDASSLFVFMRSPTVKR